ncbi:hypothetical protein HY02_10340 [Peptococcaceae bacterium SCADC1_2_3]|jgi:hypothetical protein|nr:hypothetical protein DK28_0208235 [Peptococcaceae bacterium SCADC1_2_3]KFI36300.1 hypothetical protein HY00_04400 [Peptococcaceae bacterium SCADC1_2_3]KFI37055.1 hypothetical protein HY02_10340 [Peptococcaceae bacterium SCADC1_2_3]
MQSPDIMKAKVLNDHKIMLIFKNGEQKIFDMKPYLNYPVFKPLEDQAEFNQFEIVDGTVEWKCGADLSQDTFYLESVPVSEINAMG